MGWGRISLLLVCVGCGRSDLDEPALGDGSAQPDASSYVDGSPIDATSGLDAAHDTGADAKPPCGPSTCTTCCLPDGTCASHVGSDACGGLGAACKVCPPGYACNKAPYCIKDAPNCGPSNCDGCCTGLGGKMLSYCLSGVDDLECGHGGSACLACDTKNGGKCVSQANGLGGACSTKPLPCSPTSCGGCCFGDICATGTQDIACGANGQACVDCAASARTCTAHMCF